MTESKNALPNLEQPDDTKPFRVEAHLRWSRSQEKGVVNFAPGFLLGAKRGIGDRVKALDALQDWIERLTEAYEGLLPAEAEDEGGAGQDNAEWLPIETAPKHGRPILGWGKGRASATVVVWSDAFGAWRTECRTSDMKEARWQPTHWMPLPEPPTER